MTIDGGYLISSFLGIWLIGPVVICLASLSVLVMCFRRVEANVIKPETSILDKKDFFGLTHSKLPDSDAQRFDYNNIYSHSNSCSRIWIKSITWFNYKQLQLPQRLQKDLSLLQKLHHTNINPLVGALFKDQKIYLVTPYCQLGSLQELLSNVNISFRKPLITSLIQDLICGVTYIHHSSITCHGRLKSSNCLLNSYLRLRISDFGINRLRELTRTELSSTLIDRLWLAPEILRNQDCGASCQADMYAFAVILHEIIHRQGPFNVSSTTTLDVSLIVDRIRQGPNLNTVGRVECFRPQIKDDSNLEYGCPLFIRRCLEDCWAEAPGLRPNADSVFCQLSVMRNETCSQMASNTDHELVNLKKEKEKKAKLLSNIIPSHAANELVKGLRVKPQVFESVTLLFTNIGNFLQISEISSPHEHIRLLDDIYNIFDSVVQGYHVYKVETVKDTYFVASGLFPRKNHHTVEAALLALNLLNSIRAYKVPHSPHLAILLRIGMHLGPVAAGVIGLDKPRFCLFGDTVNVTSRLSTTGEPSQIQISSECHVALLRMGGFIMKERGMIYIKGFPMEIYIAADGRVLSYILDPNFEKYLPIIPSEVDYVNFTWKSGENKKYYYHFDRLQSFNEDILQSPTISVEIRGRVPRKPKVFSVLLPCSGNSSGVASFSIGLLIESHKGKPLPGTPLRLRLRKECAERVTQVSGGGGAIRPAGAPHQHHLVPSPHASTSSASAWPPLSSLPDLLATHGQAGLAVSSSSISAGSRSRLAFAGLRHGPDPECDKKCANGGWCNHEKICQCLEGYMGQHCRTALCYPQCMNGGSCTSPGTCSCPSGFQGLHCEGGICKEKCLNGGKCIQKDTCECPKGFYGLRCEFTKCVIPCLNGGRCKGVNQCRCSPGFKGDHCEVTPPGRPAQRPLCQRPCRHGSCVGLNRCLCHEGWHGKLCHRNRQHNSTEERPAARRRKVWV